MSIYPTLNAMASPDGNAGKCPLQRQGADEVCSINSRSLTVEPPRPPQTRIDHPRRPGPRRRQFLRPDGNAPELTATPSTTPADASDITLRIAPVTVELAPDRILSTIGYNGTAPGPVLRMKGKASLVTVTVLNDTDTPEFVHWHGSRPPSDVDGAEEEGTPAVPPRQDGKPGSRTYKFTPTPSGSRWYHSHAMSMADLHRGTYTGQFGFVYIDPASNPGNYDQELFLALRDWEPFFTTQMVDMDEDTSDPNAPQPEKPTTLNTAPNGLEVTSTTYSINDKSLGAGEPIRDTQGQRVLFHFLNASANEKPSSSPRRLQVHASSPSTETPSPRSPSSKPSPSAPANASAPSSK